MKQTRASLLAKFQMMISHGQPIIGGGAGTGLSARCEEKGGIDLIVIYNSGRYRMAGRGSLAGLLAYGNANDIVMEMAKEVLPVVKNTPVLAGVNSTDPFCQFDTYLDSLKIMGFAGIQNFPTVGLIDGNFRANLEETGMGYALEVDVIRQAHKKDLLTTPYVFSAIDAKNMTEAGADIIVTHMGLTTGGDIGAKTTHTLEDCVKLIKIGRQRQSLFVKRLLYFAMAVLLRHLKMQNIFYKIALIATVFMAQVLWNVYRQKLPLLKLQKYLKR